MKRSFGVRRSPFANCGWECYETSTDKMINDNLTNREAWLEADKRNNEAKSKSESTTDWIWNKSTA